MNPMMHAARSLEELERFAYMENKSGILRELARIDNGIQRLQLTSAQSKNMAQAVQSMADEAVKVTQALFGFMKMVPKTTKEPEILNQVKSLAESAQYIGANPSSLKYMKYEDLPLFLGLPKEKQKEIEESKNASRIKEMADYQFAKKASIFNIANALSALSQKKQFPDGPPPLTPI